MKNMSEQHVEEIRADTAPARFRLGSVDIDPDSGKVSGPAGIRMLDPKVMAVLVRLATDGGRVVSRDDLMKDVWGETIVTDFALSRCVYQLRKTLSAIARTDESPIETLPKRGYRLTWPIGPTPAPKPRNDGGFALAGIVALVSLVGISVWSHWSPQVPPVDWSAGDQPRLVIFPFEDLSESHEQHAFGEGLAREIQHRLAGLPGLTLIGRTSAFDPERRDADSIGRARQLDADFLLRGSVQSFGENRRVLVDLQSAPDGELLWSREFVVDRDAPFNVVQHVADQTAQRIRFSADAEYKSETTTSLEAFEAYLAAAEAGDRDLRKQLLLRAVELDPDFAVALNELAEIDIYSVWNGQTALDDAWQQAQPFVQQALAVNPDLPDIYVTLGRFRREFGDIDGAIAQFEKALELDPGNPVALANLGIVLRPAGRYEEALQVHQMAAALDPQDALAQARLGTSHWLMENHEEAARHYAIAAKLRPNNEEIYDSWSAMLSLGMGRFDAAMEKMEQKILVEREPTPRTLFRAGELADVLGISEMAERYFLRAGAASPYPQDELSHLAAHHFILGDEQEAYDLAERVLELMPTDFTALRLMGIADVEANRPDRFLERVRVAFPDTTGGDLPTTGAIYDDLLLASALAANGEQHVADRIARSVIERIGQPRSYQHVWLAAALALRGRTAAALQELRRSPAGWIRDQAAFLLRDTQFATLRDLPEFQNLIATHLAELERQRNAYLSQTVAVAGRVE